MKHPTSQDRSHRLAFSSAELNSLLFRVLVRNRLLSPATRSAFYLRFPVRAWDSVVRVRNRCVLTGRSGSPVSRFKLSRITFRELANSGQLPGVARSSWLAIVGPPTFLNFTHHLMSSPLNSLLHSLPSRQRSGRIRFSAFSSVSSLRVLTALRSAGVISGFRRGAGNRTQFSIRPSPRPLRVVRRPSSSSHRDGHLSAIRSTSSGWSLSPSPSPLSIYPFG